MTQEHFAPIVWSAATCDFKGAGVYVGLAPGHEHMAVARGLSAKQMQLYIGGRVRSAGGPWPINYFAVRDPSAVRVIPVHRPPLPNGFKPVHLRFRFPAHNGWNSVTLSQALATAAGEPLVNGMMDTPPAAFILSVGLGAEKERHFFEETIDRHLDQAWDDVFLRVSDLGCKDTAA